MEGGASSSATERCAGSTSEEAAAYRGPGFLWIHLEGRDERDLAFLKAQHDIPDVAANALAATETRPRCDRIDEGAIVNLRGPGDLDPEDSDRLVSIRFWVRRGRVDFAEPPPARRHRRRDRPDGGGQDPRFRRSRRRLRPGDQQAARSRRSPRSATRSTMCESDLEPRQRLPACGRTITAHPLARRSASAASSRPTGTRCAPSPQLDFDWLAEDDRLHIREAADRFARMAEELEAVRERAALLHEQLTDLRAEQIESARCCISIVAFIFLPLTFITGLLGMNVEGIPYAHDAHGLLVASSPSASSWRWRPPPISRVQAVALR